MAKHYTKAIDRMYRDLGGQNIIILETDDSGKLLHPEEHQHYIDEVVKGVNQTLESRMAFKLGSLRGKIKSTATPDYFFITVKVYWKDSQFLEISRPRAYFSLPMFQRRWRKAKHVLMNDHKEDLFGSPREFYCKSKKIGLDVKTMRKMSKELTEHLPWWAKNMIDY